MIHILFIYVCSMLADKTGNVFQWVDVKHWILFEINLMWGFVDFYRGIYPYSMFVLSTGKAVSMESQLGFIIVINEAESSSKYQLVM